MAAPAVGRCPAARSSPTHGTCRTQAREEPGNLSGLRCETHPDSPSADANRCHSLPLDPIGYTPRDLLVGLFLLVTGGERSLQSFR